MSGARHARASEIFLAACELDGAVRAALLEEACGGDGALRAEVERLLAHDAAGERAFATPVASVGDAVGKAFADAQGALGSAASGSTRATADPEVTQARAAGERLFGAVPERIGRYEILGKLGEGGMGAVYEARQESPRRLVAVKVLRSGATGQADLKRFAREAELLGRLQHPGIAQIFEAGTTDAEGATRPFIAMERITGVALDDWVARERPGVERRVELVVEIARAVDHAHERGVVHRDLKPKNVLVDETGRARVLDFGIARALDADVTRASLTDPGELVGTLAYLSPEQAAGVREVDARSDVHALGVIAFEILTGAMPYDVRGRLLHEAILAIRDAEPQALSAADPALRGDLETVVGKALEKDPTRRYESARAFADDLERWLADEPVVARPASAVYQLRKFARRHRGLVAGAVGVFLALALGLVATSWQAARARAERADALRQAQRVELLLDFLLGDMLTAVDPWEDGREVRVVELLDRAAANLEATLATAPDLEVLIRGVLGEVYRNLGLFAQAEPHLRRAHELEALVRGARAPETFAAATRLAGLFVDLGRFDDARELLAGTRAEAEAAWGAEHEVVLGASLADARLRHELGDHSGAERLYRLVRDARARQLGSEHADTLACDMGLGAVLSATGRLAEARTLLEGVLAARLRTLGPEHPRTVAAEQAVAGVLRREGDLAGAAQRFAATVATSRATLGDEHADTLHGLNELASVLHDLEGPEAAEPLLAEIVANGRRVLGRDHPSLAEYTNNWASALEELGELDRAEELYLESLELRREAYGDPSARVATALNNLAVLASRRGRYAEAERFANEALAMRTTLPDVPARLVAEGHANYGTALHNLGRFEEALVQYETAFVAMGELEAPEAGVLAVVQHQLGWTLFRLGLREEAEPHLLAAFEAFTLLDHPQRDASRIGLLRFYTDWGRPERAAEYAEAAAPSAR